MIARLVVTEGTAPGTLVPVSLGSLTILVGPNNSGKSLLLREIREHLGGQPVESGRFKILRRIEPVPFDREEVQRLMLARVRNSTPGHDGGLATRRVSLREGPGHDGQGPTFYPERSAKEILESPTRMLSNVLGLYMLVLDGISRLELTNPMPLSSFQEAPGNHLSALFRDDGARNRFRELSFEAFGEHCILDPTSQPGRIELRMSAEQPGPHQEQSLRPEDAKFLGKGRGLADYSDGVRAYLGILAGVMSTDHRIILIDEPEAFLHPPLARRLGLRLSQVASERDGNVIAATHSADFLLGTASSGAPLNIMRLTYDRHEGGKVRLLDPGQMTSLMRDPFLRSTDALSALFFRAAAVCEGGVDVAFYQEINRRLGDAGVDDCTFLATHTKASVHRVLGPLRKLGIPTAAVVDLDILKGNDLKTLLHTASVPQATIDSWGTWRGNLLAEFEKAAKAPKDGIDVLEKGSRDSAGQFLTALAAYGIFVVPCGTVECWLRQLGASGAKGTWLANIFELMGADPAADGYARPGSGDVWDFLSAIGKWTSDPNRLGMP